MKNILAAVLFVTMLGLLIEVTMLGIVKQDELRDAERERRESYQMAFNLPCMEHCPVKGRIENINRKKERERAAELNRIEAASGNPVVVAFR